MDVAKVNFLIVFASFSLFFLENYPAKSEKKIRLKEHEVVFSSKKLLISYFGNEITGALSKVHSLKL